MQFYLFLLFAGAVVGFFSGLLGIGGGILMFPLLLYVPPVLGLELISVKSITGLTMIQGFFASLSAMFFYHRYNLVNKSLVLTLGLSLFLSSLTGSFISKMVPDKPLLFVFGALACIAAVMMLIPRSYAKDELTEDTVSFHKPGAIIIGVTIGFLIGLVGQGGRIYHHTGAPVCAQNPSQGSVGKHPCNRAFFFISRSDRKGRDRTSTVPSCRAPPARGCSCCTGREYGREKDEDAVPEVASGSYNYPYCGKDMGGPL